MVVESNSYDDWLIFEGSSDEGCPHVIYLANSIFLVGGIPPLPFPIAGGPGNGPPAGFIPRRLSFLFPLPSPFNPPPDLLFVPAVAPLGRGMPFPPFPPNPSGAPGPPMPTLPNGMPFPPPGALPPDFRVPPPGSFPPPPVQAMSPPQQGAPFAPPGGGMFGGGGDRR